jgi:hypothetical protein
MPRQNRASPPVSPTNTDRTQQSRVRGDQAGRPTSKNLPAPFLTTNATIAQRTSTYENGTLVNAAGHRNVATQGAAPPQVSSQHLQITVEPAGGGATTNARRLPPTSSTPSLPLITPQPDVASSGGRKRSNTQKPMTRDRHGRTPTVQMGSSAVPPDASRPAAAKHTIVDDGEPVSTPTAATVTVITHVAQLDRTFRSEDADYAAFMKKRGKPGALPSVAKAVGRVPDMLASTPTRTATGGKIVSTDEGSKTAPLLRPRALFSPTGAKGNFYEDIRRSPRRRLEFDLPSTIKLPAPQAALPQPHVALPELVKDPDDLVLVRGVDPASSQHTAAYRTPSPGTTRRPELLKPSQLTTDVSLLTDGYGGSPRHNVDNPTSTGPVANGAGRYRVDVAAIDFAPSPTALSRTGAHTVPPGSSVAGSSGVYSDVYKSQVNDLDDATIAEARLRRQRRHDAALRTIEVTTTQQAGVNYAGDSYGEADDRGTAAAPGSAHQEVHALPSDSLPKNYAQAGYASYSQYGGASKPTSHDANADVQRVQLVPASYATVSPQAPSVARESTSSPNTFRLRLADRGSMGSPSVARATPPQPRLSFLVLAEQIAALNESSGTLNGSAQYTVRSPAVLSPHHPGPTTPHGDTSSPSKRYDSTFAYPRVLEAVSSLDAPAGGCALTLSQMQEAMGAGSAASSTLEEDPGDAYLSEAASKAEARYWLQLRGARRQSVFAGYATQRTLLSGHALTRRSGPAATSFGPRRGLSTVGSDSNNEDSSACFGDSTLSRSQRPLEAPSKPPVPGRDGRRVGMETIRRSAVDVGACHRPWNDAFQALLERPCATPHESLERASCIRRLSEFFEEALAPVVESVILERGVPDEERTVKLQHVGGIAGGDKYAIGNIFLKYCGSAKAESAKLYGDHLSAMKSATNELKGLNAVCRANVSHLHVPLGMTATFLGQRLWVCGRLPIDGSRTLKFGSNDAGATVRTEDAPSRLMAGKLAGILNLKPHRVGSAVVPTPVDLEFHLGDDGRYYVVDTARLFPPDANPASGLPRNYHLHKLLRAELVHDNAEAPLSADALCRLGQRDPHYLVHDREVVEASLTITTSCIPMLSHQVGRIFADEGVRRLEGPKSTPAPRPRGAVHDSGPSTVVAALLNTPASLLLKSSMHEYGVNLRYLGRLLDEYVTWSAHASQPVPPTVVCTTIVAEIVARSFKAVVHSQFNDFTNAAIEREQALKTAAAAGAPRPEDEANLLRANDVASYHHLIVEFYERLLAGNSESKHFWALALMPMVMRKFKCSAESLEAIFSCHSRSSVEVSWIAPNFLHKIIFIRCNELLGVSWHVDLAGNRDAEFVSRLGNASAGVSRDVALIVSPQSSRQLSPSASTSQSLPPSSYAPTTTIFSLALLAGMQPVIKGCDVSPFAAVAELVRNRELEKAERLYLAELDIRELAVGETPVLAPLLTNLADLYRGWGGREADELNLRRRIVLIYQRAWDATIAANPNEFSDFFAEATGDAVADMDTVLRAIPRADLARASSCTILLPITPPYVEALNQLGQSLLTLVQTQEAVDVLSTAARMALARLAVAAYANPSRVIAEQILHDENELAMDRRRQEAARNPRDLAAPPAQSRSVKPEGPQSKTPSSPPFVLIPVERAALEAELELNAVTSRRLLAEAYLQCGSIPDALTQRHAAVVTARRICERQSEVVLSLATVMSPTGSELGNSFASASRLAGSPRGDGVGVRAMLAEVGVAPVAPVDESERSGNGRPRPTGRATGGPVGRYCEVLCELSRTLALCGRSKYACAATDEALRVLLAPLTTIKYATTGGTGDQPDTVSPIHQPGVLDWLRLHLRSAVVDSARAACDALTTGAKAPATAQGGASVVTGSGASIILAETLLDRPMPTDEVAVRHRGLQYEAGLRVLDGDDRDLMGGLIDVPTGGILRELHESLTGRDIATTLLAAVQARLEDSAFVGDAALILPAAIEAFNVLLGSTCSSVAPSAAVPPDQLLLKPALCRAAATIANLLLRVGAHREGRRLLQRCLAAARAAYEAICEQGQRRHEGGLLVAELALACAEATVFPAVEAEAFLPVLSSSLKTHSQTDEGQSPSITPATSARGVPSAHASAMSEAQPVSVARVLAAQQLLREGISIASECLDRDDGPLLGRLRVVLAATQLLLRPTCSLIPAFTAPSAQNASHVPTSRDDVGLTRYVTAAPGMTRYLPAVQGLHSLKHSVAVGLMSLELAGDLSSRYQCLGLCVQGLASLLPLSDAVVLTEVLAAEFRMSSVRRAAAGRGTVPGGLSEPPNELSVARVLCELHGIKLPIHDADSDEGVTRARSESRTLTSPTRPRSISPTGLSDAPIETPQQRMIRRLLSHAFDQFFRALATSDEHMSSDMLDFFSRRCINHATFLEARLGIRHNAPAQRISAALQVSAPLVPAAAGQLGKSREMSNAGLPHGASSAVPLSRGCHKRRLQTLLLLAPEQLQHGETTSGIGSCKALLALFRDLFPYRMPWDALEDSLLPALRGLGSWLLRTQPIGADRELGATIIRVVEREEEKKLSFLRAQATRAAESAEELAKEAFVVKQQRITAQLQQIMLFSRLQRVDNVRSLLVHALDDYASLYPDGAVSNVTHSIQSHNELVTQLRNLRRLMGVPQAVLDDVITSFEAGLQRPQAAADYGTPSATPGHRSMVSTPRHGRKSSSGAPVWQRFAKDAVNASASSSRRAGAHTVVTAVQDAQHLARYIVLYEQLVYHAISCLYDLRTLPPDFAGHAIEVLDLAHRFTHRLQAFSLP